MVRVGGLAGLEEIGFPVMSGTLALAGAERGAVEAGLEGTAASRRDSFLFWKGRKGRVRGVASLDVIGFCFLVMRGMLGLAGAEGGDVDVQGVDDSRGTKAWRQGGGWRGRKGKLPLRFLDGQTSFQENGESFWIGVLEAGLEGAVAFIRDSFLSWKGWKRRVGGVAGLKEIAGFGFPGMRRTSEYDNPNLEGAGYEIVGELLEVDDGRGTKAWRQGGGKNAGEEVEMSEEIIVANSCSMPAGVKCKPSLDNSSRFAPSPDLKWTSWSTK
jgi:hypothetical protein